MIKIILIILLSFIFPANIEELLSYSNKNLLSNNESQSNINSTDLSSIKHDLEELVFLDETIDPDKYIVGPGDNLSFNLISSDGSVLLTLSVSPIGDILIPNVGNINIDNLSLTNAINKIKSQCKEKYANAEIFVSLQKFRKFKVQIYGSGTKNGYLTITPIHRLSHIYAAVMQDSKNLYSIRNIEILRDSEVFKYDLLDFFIFGNEESNPYIMQNDKIKLYLRQEYITISGGVNLQGVYDYKKYETLENIIEIAGNFTINADSNYIEITRFINDQDYNLILIDNYEQNKRYEIKSFDNIRVRKKTDFKRADYIAISGEVKYPGKYLLSEINSYNSLISLAGGLTSKADTSQIIINNNSINLDKDIELQRISIIPDMDRTPSEKAYVKARKKINKGSLLSNDITFTEFIKNIKPEADDEIIIPIKINYVEVIGAVVYPGRYSFVKDYNGSNYIKNAGGLNNSATKNKYLIRSSNGQRITLKNNTTIENGDIIFIAEKDDYNSFVRFKDVLEILGNFAALIAVIQNVIGN